MTRMSPAESDSSLVSFGASLQFTCGDRLWIRGCAVLVALLASTTALFAQANDLREAFTRPAVDARRNAAFDTHDELFRTPSTEPEVATLTSTPAPAVGASDRAISPAKTPIRRDSEIVGSTSAPRHSTSLVWVIVFALIAAAGGVSVWARRHPGSGARSLPGSVFQVLGRQQVGPGQAVVVARLGDRVLLLSSGSDGLRTLSEVTDLAEASRITAECLAASSGPARVPKPSLRPVPPGQVSTTAFQVVGNREEQLRAAISPVLNHGEDLGASREIPSRRDRLSTPFGREVEHG